MDRDRYCQALAAEAARFAGLVDGADPGAPVPTCPDWDVRELVRHVGSIHRWAGAMVRDLAQSRLSFKALNLAFPAGDAALAAWFRAGVDELLAALKAADPEAAMWAWGADQHARFWPRRMLHETGMHRADLELALGREPAFEEELAVDGIDEFLANLPHAASFAPNVKDLRGSGESLHLHCTDAEGEWLIELAPDGFTWRHGHAKGSVAIRGAASDLLLLTYGRRRLGDGRYQLFGDSAVAERWFASAHI